MCKFMFVTVKTLGKNLNIVFYKLFVKIIHLSVICRH